jgi:PAP2 superfamily
MARRTPGRVALALLFVFLFSWSSAAAGHGDDAEVVYEWNAILERSLAPPGLPPAGLQAFRYFAMLNIAMFDAVNSVEDRYHPYRVHVRFAHGASAEAAAAQAARDVLAAVLPVNIADYDAALAARLATIPRVRARLGVRVGARVAAEILAWRLDDGWRLTPPPTYVLPLLPGLWQPTAAGQVAGGTQIPGVKPFALLTATQFLPPNPPTLTSDTYAAHVNEVKSIGKSDSAVRTADQTEVARLIGGFISPIGPPALWTHVARVAARDAGFGLVDAARLLALATVATHDGILTSQTSKFVFGLWRPVTAIRQADVDLNDATEPDSTWEPLISTPPYPAYAGNVACISASAATALALAFGTDEVAFTMTWPSSDATHPADYVRDYTGFWHLANEAALSRLWGGIHFRFDHEASQTACPKVGQFVFDNYMRPQRR